MTKEQHDNKKLIHDYALEPELVAECDQFLYRYFYKQFSGDTGCIAVQYPYFWRRLVQKLVGDDKRLEVLLAWLPRKQVVRNAPKWNDSFTWLKNAEQEKIPHPFHVILARDNPRKQSNVVRAEDISSGTANRAWDNPPPSVTVNRTATSMAVCLEPLLRYATQIHFIDPYFRASEPRWRNPLEEFLKIICDGSCEVTLEYHASACYKNAPSWDYFLSECKQYLPRLIPRGFTLTVRRWKNRDIGEELHDRYILTNIGGVVIPRGLDESDEYTLPEKDRGTIDILRVSLETWQQRLEDYGYDNSKPAFDLEGEVEIIGTL